MFKEFIANCDMLSSILNQIIESQLLVQKSLNKHLMTDKRIAEEVKKENHDLLVAAQLEIIKGRGD